MTGVAAAKLVQKDLNGASAVIVEETDPYRGDVDRRWYMGEQYFKSYPICRLAQAPVEGARSLMRRHGFVQKIYERSTSILFTTPLGLQLIRQKRPKKHKIQPLFRWR